MFANTFTFNQPKKISRDIYEILRSIGLFY